MLSLFWCVCSAFFLGHLRFSAACHAAGYPSRVPHLADSGWLTYSCSGHLLWGWRCLVTGVLIHHLVFYLVLAQLPLPLLPLRGSAPFLAPVRWSTTAVEPCGWVGGVFPASLGLLSCAMFFLPDRQLAWLPLQRVPLEIFRSQGVCPSASLVT